jgi:ubiquinone/menaquinone biosynthesis C-methylase UbiE
MAQTTQLANTEQAIAWDGEEGKHWSTHAERYDAAVMRYDRVLGEAAAIGENENVMDIGCGCGFSSRQAARLAASATVLGVDLSGPMIDHARRRSIDEGLTNTEFLQADAQVYPFAPRSFDVAISRFGAMFFGDPVAAFTNVAAALRPGGRLALLAWQDLGPRVGIALAGPARVGSASGAVARWQWSLTAERGRACR